VPLVHSLPVLPSAPAIRSDADAASARFPPYERAASPLHCVDAAATLYPDSTDRLRYVGARHRNVWRRAEQCARKAQHRAHFGGHGFQGHGWMLASRAEAQQPWPTTSCTAVNCLPASALTPLPTDTPRTHHSVGSVLPSSAALTASLSQPCRRYSL
jgi:hypothetical protein